MESTIRFIIRFIIMYIVLVGGALTAALHLINGNSIYGVAIIVLLTSIASTIIIVDKEKEKTK